MDTSFEENDVDISSLLSLSGWKIIFWLEKTAYDERDLEDDIKVLSLENNSEKTCCICKTCDSMSIISPMIPSLLAFKLEDKPQASTTEEINRQKSNGQILQEDG